MPRHARIPARTVRFWAWVDSAVSWPLALPPLAPYFIAALYAINGWLGGEASPPPFAPMQMLFVYLTGTMVGIWVLARLLHPVGLLALIDGWGRLYVALLLVWLIVALDGPPVLWLFVLTEGAGAFAQLRAAYAPRRPGVHTGARRLRTRKPPQL